MKEEKIINNTAVPVLKGLLNKTKITTIRSAFKKVQSIAHDEKPWIPKPCKYVVGEVYDMVWDKDSEFPVFHKITGEGSHIPLDFTSRSIFEEWNETHFNKSLGKVRILKNEKIEIKDTEIVFTVKKNGIPLDTSHLKKLAKNDGFSSVGEMFKYLDEYADLSTPKEFHLTTFEWVEE